MRQTLKPEQFYKEHDEAKKLEKEKRIGFYPIKLGVNAHLDEPYSYWYHVSIGYGWDWNIEFGTDYAKAKTFYDNIDWFVDIMIQFDKVKDTNAKSLREIWKIAGKQCQ